MSLDSKPQPQPPSPRPPEVEQRGAAEWIAAGAAVADLGLTTWQTFRPSPSGQASPPPETPTVILPPGVDRE